MFAYGKTPLGTVLRFVRKSIVAFADAHEKAMDIAKKLESMGLATRVLDVSKPDEMYEAALIDPDVVDVGLRYVIIAEWI